MNEWIVPLLFGLSTHSSRLQPSLVFSIRRRCQDTWSQWRSWRWTFRIPHHQTAVRKTGWTSEGSSESRNWTVLLQRCTRVRISNSSRSVKCRPPFQYLLIHSKCQWVLSHHCLGHTFCGCMCSSRCRLCRPVSDSSKKRVYSSPLSLHFHSDESLTHKGFYLLYRAFSPESSKKNQMLSTTEEILQWQC